MPQFAFLSVRQAINRMPVLALLLKDDGEGFIVADDLPGGEREDLTQLSAAQDNLVRRKTIKALRFVHGREYSTTGV